MSGRWRWWGFGGSVLLAVSGLLAGALPSGDPGAGFRTGGFGAVPGSFTIGLACWLVGASMLVIAWLRASDAGLRPALTTGALWAFPLVIAPPLGSRDIYAYACQGWIWWHGADPYAVGVTEGGCPWAESVPALWWDTPTPYGPLAVVLSGLAASTESQLATMITLRLIALLSAALLAWQLPRLAARCGLSPAFACRLGLVTPLVLIHGISAAHNDILLTALLLTALTLAAQILASSGKSSPPTERIAPFPGNRDDHAVGGAAPRDVKHGMAEQGMAAQGADLGGAAARGMTGIAVAGLLVALAVGVKVTAVVALPFVLVLAGRRWAVALAAAVGGFAGLSLATGLGLGWISALRDTGELAQWSSVPTAIGMAIGYLLRPFGISADVPITAVRVIGVVTLAVFAVMMVRRAWRRRNDTRAVIVACGLTMAATALLGPVFYPWYAIAPLAVLAASVKPHANLPRSTVVPTVDTGRRPASRWPSDRDWLVVATVICTFLTLPNGLGVPVLTKAVGAFAVTAAVIVVAIRTRRPARAA